MNNNCINHKDVAKVVRINKSSKSLISESKNQNCLTYIDFDPIINAKLYDARVAISSEKLIDQFIDDFKDSISKVITKKIYDDDITDDFMADHMSQHHFLLYMIYKKQLITGKSKISGFRKDLTDSEKKRIEGLFLQYVKDVKAIINKANKRKVIEKKGLSIEDDLTDPNNKHYKQVIEIKQKAEEARELLKTTSNNEMIETIYGPPDPKVTERILTVDLPELQKKNREKREREAYERKMNQRKEFDIRLEEKNNKLIKSFIQDECVEGSEYSIDQDTFHEAYKQYLHLRCKCNITRMSFIAKIKILYPEYKNKIFYGITTKAILSNLNITNKQEKLHIE
jgi:hypothetical protein